MFKMVDPLILLSSILDLILLVSDFLCKFFFKLSFVHPEAFDSQLVTTDSFLEFFYMVESILIIDSKFDHLLPVAE